MTIIKGWNNPFLRNMPMVAIIRQKGTKNTHEIISEETQSKRVFFRVPNNTVYPSPIGEVEILPTNTPTDKALGFDKLSSF